MTVLVLCTDWTERQWGGEPGAQSAHSGRGEGGDGGGEEGRGTPVWMVGWGVRPSSLVPGPLFFFFFFL